MDNTTSKICSLILLTQMLGGCAAAAITAGLAGAAGTASVAADPRTTGTIVEDEAIEIKARQAWTADKELREQAHLNVTSYDGNVLLTGEAPTEQLRTRAVDLVLAIPKVTRIYNEIALAAPSSMTSRGSDTLITSKVKTQLLAEEDTSGFNVKVVTENGVVYLMGIVSASEAIEAIEVTRRIDGVQRVVSLLQDSTGMATVKESGDSG